MPNFLIIPSNAALADFKKYRIGQIDGAKTPTLKSFYQAIEKALSFPEYFEHNLESLDELLNDLEWIKQADVALYITNTEGFLAQEKPAKILELFNLLDATAEDWKWVDDDEDVQQKNFKIIIQDSPKIIGLLEKEEIGFDRMGSRDV
ncbi:barstar family protein [Runella sp.]|jgi:RNAse (barnase) inhibitor barstar|uniref:barstar family protein n=1 Tax=Runella sp. TaxID=1960881 RepID=UPI0026254D07|nr:barstar family protein [Runella sp.]